MLHSKLVPKKQKKDTMFPLVVLLSWSENNCGTWPLTLAVVVVDTASSLTGESENERDKTVKSNIKVTMLMLLFSYLKSLKRSSCPDRSSLPLSPMWHCSSVLLAPPPGPQPGLPPSLPLPHPGLSRHRRPGEPADAAQRLHHLAADAPVARGRCHGCPALGPAEGPHASGSAPAAPLLCSPPW